MVSVVRGFLGNVIVFLFQLMAGFHFFSQGIPRMICQRLRLRTMSLSFSVLCLNRISVWAFHRMVPLALAVPSTLLVMMDLGSFSRSNLRRQRRPTSIKFPVAPQLTRVVVLMICIPLDSLMGICMVLSLGRAVITWFTIWEEYINGSSQAKNPQVLQMLRSPGDLHSTVSGFGELQLCPSLASSRFERMLRWQRLGESGIGVELGHGVCGVGSIGGVNVLRVRGGLVVLTGTVSRLSASEAQFLPDTASSFCWG